MAAATVTKKEKESTSRKTPVKKSTTKKEDVKEESVETDVVEDDEVKAPKEAKKATKKKVLSAETVVDTEDEVEEETETPKKTTKAKAPKKAAKKTTKKTAAKKTPAKPRAKKTVKADVVVTDEEEDAVHEQHTDDEDNEGLQPVDVKVTKMRRPRKIKGCEAYEDDQGRLIPARKIAFSNLYLAYVVERKEAVDMDKMTPIMLTDWDGRKAAKAATKQHLLDNKLMTGKRDVYLLEIFDHLSTGNKKRIATHAYSVRYTMQHKTKTIVNKKATFNREVTANPKRIPAENLVSFHKQCMEASNEFDRDTIDTFELKNRPFVDISEDSGDEEEITVDEFQTIVSDRDAAAAAEVQKEATDAER